jgi:hypothetical protein
MRASLAESRAVCVCGIALYLQRFIAILYAKKLWTMAVDVPTLQRHQSIEKDYGVKRHG